MSEINELKEQLAEMQQRINELEHEQMAQPVQRRNMLKAVAGVAAVRQLVALDLRVPQQPQMETLSLSVTKQTSQTPQRCWYPTTHSLLGARVESSELLTTGLAAQQSCLTAPQASRMISQQTSARR